MSARICLLWHSIRSPNLGWGALTISNVAMLRAAAHAARKELAIRVVNLDGPLCYPPESIPLDEVVISPSRGSIFRKSWSAISDCDIIMDICGGDLLADTYGNTNLSLIVSSQLPALLRRKRFILSPQTIGPFRNSYARIMATQVTRHCEKIFTRDAQSIEVLRELGIEDRAEATADVAFRLPFMRQPRHSDRNEIRLGLNVSGLVYQACLTGRYSFGLKVDYPSLVDRIIKSFMTRPDISIVLVPHVFGNDRLDDDYWICRKLANQFGLELAPKFTSPSEAKSFISGLDVLAGSRMHATIAAVSSGVPTIPLAYSGKFLGVFTALDYPLVCDLRSQDEDSVMEDIRSGIDQLPELRTAAATANSIAQQKLERYQEYLTQTMRSLQ